MIDIIWNIWIILASLIIIGGLRFTWKKVRINIGAPPIMDLLFLAALCRAILFLLLPAIVRLFTDWKYDRIYNVMPSEIGIVYAIELLSYYIWMFTLIMIGRFLRKKRFNINKLGKSRKPGANILGVKIFYKDEIESLFNHNKEKSFLFLTVICTIFIILSLQKYSLDQGFFSTNWAEILWPVAPFIIIAGSVAAIFLVITGSYFGGALAHIIGLATLVVYLLGAFVSGVRGTIIWPAFWGIFLSILMNSKRYAVICICIISIVMMFQNQFLGFRSINRISDISHVEKILEISKGGRFIPHLSILEHIENRLGGSTRYSVGFIRMKDRGYSAGWKPILTALYVPIPRFIMHDKPVPGSVDGTTWTMGMYAASAEITGHPFSMCEVQTGCQAYWEIGFWGIILFSIIPALYVGLGAYHFSKLGSAGLVAMVTILKPWGYNQPKIWISEIILQLFHIIFPIITIWIICGFLLKNKVFCNLIKSLINDMRLYSSLPRQKMKKST